MKHIKLVSVISFLALVLLLSTLLTPQDIPKMTKEELSAMLGNADLVIFDFRSEGHWENADSKIRDALREDRADIASWADNYRRDKVYVIY